MAMFDREQFWTINGIPKTNSLFHETCRQGDQPIMSLHGGGGLPSLRTYFVNLTTNDPSEYTFAETVFGDIRYWFRLRDAKFLVDLLPEWREEADMKRKQLAFKAIINEVENEGRSSFSAAKFLIDEPWKGQKKEVKETRKKTTQKAVSVFDQDIERLKEEGLLQ
jgi:hypothetical protein